MDLIGSELAHHVNGGVIPAPAHFRRQCGELSDGAGHYVGVLALLVMLGPCEYDPVYRRRAGVGRAVGV